MAVVQLPDHLQQVIDEHVAKGHAASEAAFLEEAVLRHADQLDTLSPEPDWEDVRVRAKQGIAEIESGDFITIATEAERESYRAAVMARVQARLARGRG